MRSGQHRQGGVAVTVDMVPAWMHELVTAEQYDSWAEEQCAGIEIVDGMVVVSPKPSVRHNRTMRIIATALDRAGKPHWNSDNDFDLRLRDVPLLNRQPDVVVYRADAIDVVPIRPEHILLVAEIVSPGSETIDRKTKPDEYARAGIRHYWRVENADTDSPVVFTYMLDEATCRYADAGVFTRVIKTDVPFDVEIDLSAF
jgi:Uma2 family endonuclease